MKYENLRKVAALLRESHLNLETLEAIRDNKRLFSQEVCEEFDQFMKDGRKLFFGEDDDGQPR